jgi:ribosomal protein L11 methyltransferase
VILSGILNEQADEVVATYEAVGFGLRSRDEYGDWTTLVLNRQQ